MAARAVDTRLLTTSSLPTVSCALDRGRDIDCRCCARPARVVSPHLDREEGRDRAEPEQVQQAASEPRPRRLVLQATAFPLADRQRWIGGVG